MDCVFRKPFAFFANRLRFSQKGITMQKSNDLNIHTIHKAIYSADRNKWAWQIGDERYCERHFSKTEQHAFIESQMILQKYMEFDETIHASVMFDQVLWQNDKSNGYIGRFTAYEFWISPIHHVKNGLWRYDIYHLSDPKSVCYGVAQSKRQAQLSCIRFALVAKI